MIPLLPTACPDNKIHSVWKLESLLRVPELYNPAFFLYKLCLEAHKFALRSGVTQSNFLLSKLSLDAHIFALHS